MRKRRRKVIAGLLVLVAAGVAWWVWLDRLTATEQLLVGTWRLRSDTEGLSGPWVFSPDRQSHFSLFRAWGGMASGTTGAGRWCIQGGVLIEDGDDNTMRRATRPLYRLLGWP